MDWKRQLPTTAFLVLLALASWEGSRRLTEYAQSIVTTDDLAWLRRQYHPDAAHWDVIQSLHRHHRQACDTLARELELKSRALAEVLDRDDAISGPVQELLDDIGVLRGRCHVAALRHTLDISRQLPPEESRQHLVEVEHQLLGLEPDWHRADPPPRGLAGLKRHSILADR